MSTVAKFERLKDNEFIDEFKKEFTGRLIGTKTGRAWGRGKTMADFQGGFVEMLRECAWTKEIE